MTPLKPELQGEGTYTYECSNPKCAYCIWTGDKKPIPEKRYNWYPQPKSRVSVISIAHKWLPEELDILKANQDLYWRDIAKLVPLHPVDSVAATLTRLRSRGILRPRIYPVKSPV